MSNFSSLNLSPWMCDALSKISIKTPTEIQARCIPEITQKKEVVGCAYTGSGKTLAFALPIIQDLAKDPYGIFALVLTPTRELAFQIGEQFAIFGEAFPVHTSVIVGGMDELKQSRELDSIPHIIIATPGRLAEFIRAKHGALTTYLQNIKYLVIDEADALLTGNFTEDLHTIVDILPKERQTLMFSATLSPALLSEEVLEKYFDKKKPVYVNTNKVTAAQTAEELNQKFMLIPLNLRECYLVNLLNVYKGSMTIVFAATYQKCHFLHLLLEKLEITSTIIHSQMPQKKRLENLQKFKSEQAKILVATDVASRGLDIPSVDLVVNYDLPLSPATYVHRVGRTARAGRSGLSISLVTQFDVQVMLEIEKYIKKKLAEYTTKENDVMELIKPVYKAIKFVKIDMNEKGLNELFEKRKRNKRKQLPPPTKAKKAKPEAETQIKTVNSNKD